MDRLVRDFFSWSLDYTVKSDVTYEHPVVKADVKKKFKGMYSSLKTP